MCFKHAPYWRYASSPGPLKIQLLCNCNWIPALYLFLSTLSTAIWSTSILSTAVLSYEMQLLGYNSLVVRDCMRIVPTWRWNFEIPPHLHFRHFSCIYFLRRCPFLSITQDFQMESVAESHFPRHPSVTKITRLLCLFLQSCLPVSMCSPAASSWGLIRETDLWSEWAPSEWAVDWFFVLKYSSVIFTLRWLRLIP